MRVLFVCLHGAAKSVIAAEHFRRIALASNCEVEVSSAGVEPDEAIPAHVVAGLQGDGFDVSGSTPQRLTDSSILAADLVVSFGCPLEHGGATIRWDDVPQVSDGYALARDAIVARVEKLVRDVAASAPPQTARD